jgi:hypothetical protein
MHSLGRPSAREAIRFFYLILIFTNFKVCEQGDYVFWCLPIPRQFPMICLFRLFSLLLCASPQQCTSGGPEQSFQHLLIRLQTLLWRLRGYSKSTVAVVLPKVMSGVFGYQLTYFSLWTILIRLSILYSNTLKSSGLLSWFLSAC